MLIIGAGAAGLAAADRLYRAGVTDFVVVEAGDRLELEVMVEHPWLVGQDSQAEVELSFDWDFPADPDQTTEDDLDSDSDSSI